MKTLFLLIILIFFSLPIFSQNIGNPFITNYLPKEYKAELQNWYSTENNNGIMYFANSDGKIIEYDGEEFRLIEIAEHITVRSLFTDTEGIIWVALKDKYFGYLESDKNGEIHFYSISEYLPEEFKNFENIWRINQLNDDIYFKSNKEIYIWNKVKKEISVIKPSSNFHRFSFIFNDLYYTAQKEQGFCFLKDDSLYSVEKSEFYLEKIGRSFKTFSLNDTILFMSENNGLSYYFLKENLYKKIETSFDTFMINSTMFNGTFTKDKFVFNNLTKGAVVSTKKFEPLFWLNNNTGLSTDVI